MGRGGASGAGKGREGRGRERKGRGGKEGKEGFPPNCNSWIRPWQGGSCFQYGNWAMGTAPIQPILQSAETRFVRTTPTTTPCTNRSVNGCG